MTGLPAMASFEGHRYVVGGALDVVLARRGLAVDGAGVHQLALRIDHEHVRRGARAVGVTDRAVIVHQHRGGLRTFALQPGGEFGGFLVVARSLAVELTVSHTAPLASAAFCTAGMLAVS